MKQQTTQITSLPSVLTVIDECITAKVGTVQPGTHAQETQLIGGLRGSIQARTV